MKQEFKIVPVQDIPLGEEVPLDDLFKIYVVCQKLEVICEKEKGIGISAVQVGIPWNLFIIKSETGFDYFVNCYYISIPEICSPFTCTKINVLEGCLSIRSNNGKPRYFNVERFSKIMVTGKKLVFENKDLSLKEIKSEISDFKAVVMQHELDHSKGILISSIGEEVDIYKLQGTKC